MAHPPLDSAPGPGDRFDQQPVQKRDRKVRLDHGEGFVRHLGRVLGQLCHRDDREDRRFLDQDDGLVNRRRHDQAEHLGDLDPVDDLPAAEADHLRGLDLALGNRFEARPEDLGEVARPVKAEAQNADRLGIEHQPERGATVVEQEQDDQDRRAAHDFDVGPRGGAHHRQASAEQQAQGQA